MAAVEAAKTEGYGECFWPEPTGQYWWMFRLVDERLEVAVLWTAGGARHENVVVLRSRAHHEEVKP